MTLDHNQKEFLLEAARASIGAAVGIPPGGPSSAGASREKDDAVPDWAQFPSGAFVTLKEAGELRGCIGCMTAQDSLYRTVERMAKAAALEDPRFEPLEARELSLVKIEISVLTPMVPIDDVEKIEVGRHGVHVSLGYRSAVFLPQVPVEWSWDRETYLRQLLRKAQLPDAAMEDPRIRFSVFEAIVFGED